MKWFGAAKRARAALAEAVKKSTGPTLRQEADGSASRLMTCEGRELRFFGDQTDSYFLNTTLDAASHSFIHHVLDRRVRRDSVCFDVGANIGFTTAMLSRRAPEGAVVSFEPSPSAYRHLARMVAENGLANVTLHQLALSSEEGEVGFLDNHQSASASHIASGESLGGSTTLVRATTLDRIVRDSGIQRLDFMKVDVEGYEMSVLEGAVETLASLKPDLFIEVNSFTLLAYGNTNPRTFIEYLMKTYEYVYRFSAGQVLRVSTQTDLLDLIHANLVHNGCVDDLFCSKAPLD